MRIVVSLSILAATGLFAAPAAAATGTYRAVPTTAPTQGSFITRSTIWHCDGAGCTAAHDGQRDQVICQLAAREIGTLASFTVDGAAFDAAALAKCNKHAN